MEGCFRPTIMIKEEEEEEEEERWIDPFKSYSVSPNLHLNKLLSSHIRRIASLRFLEGRVPPIFGLLLPSNVLRVVVFPRFSRKNTTGMMIGTMATRTHSKGDSFS